MCLLLALAAGVILFVFLLNRKSLELSITSLSVTLIATLGIVTFIVFLFFKCVAN